MNENSIDYTSDKRKNLSVFFKLKRSIKADFFIFNAKKAFKFLKNAFF